MSQIIRQLEARVGGHLFDRTSRRVRLTPLGERLRSNLAPICAQLERALDDVHHATTDVVGTLRIGMYAPPSLGSYMVDIVRTFETGHPEADVSRAAIMSTSRARRTSR